MSTLLNSHSVTSCCLSPSSLESPKSTVAGVPGTAAGETGAGPSRGVAVPPTRCPSAGGSSAAAGLWGRRGAGGTLTESKKVICIAVSCQQLVVLEGVGRDGEAVGAAADHREGPEVGERAQGTRLELAELVEADVEGSATRNNWEINMGLAKGGGGGVVSQNG